MAPVLTYFTNTGDGKKRLFWSSSPCEMSTQCRSTFSHRALGQPLGGVICQWSHERAREHCPSEAGRACGPGSAGACPVGAVFPGDPPAGLRPFSPPLACWSFLISRSKFFTGISSERPPPWDPCYTDWAASTPETLRTRPPNGASLPCRWGSYTREW